MALLVTGIAVGQKKGHLFAFVRHIAGKIA
jgi:hypothetical protein